MKMGQIFSKRKDFEYRLSSQLAHISYQYNIFQGELSQVIFMFEDILQQSTTQQQNFLSLFQTHKRICSQYIKIASQRLYPQEAKRISQANDLLQKLSTKERVKDLSEWDVFSTRDSVILQDDSSLTISNISFESKSRVISRKNTMGTRTVRDFDGNINESLQQIEKECSQKTAAIIKKLAEEYKRMRVRVQENQKIEKSTRASQKMIEDLRQKQFIMTQKIQNAQELVEKLRTENAQLKAENKELSEKMYKKSNEIISEKKIKLYEEIASNKNIGNTPKKGGHYFHGNAQILNRLIEEKQKIFSIRLEEIRSIESKVEGLLFKEQQACSNCCTMLRKMKGSILTYKAYLQKQGEQFENMFDGFKEKILKHQKENQ